MTEAEIIRIVVRFFAVGAVIIVGTLALIGACRVCCWWRDR